MAVTQVACSSCGQVVAASSQAHEQQPENQSPFMWQLIKNSALTALHGPVGIGKYVSAVVA